jgi:hypothetical protein
MTLPATRDLLDEQRLWTVAARIAKHDGETEFWRLTDEGAISVSVVTLQHSIPTWALLKGGDNAGNGLWAIPNEGTEVVVACENGDIENDAYVVGFLGHAIGDVAANKTILVGNEVIVRTTGSSESVDVKSGAIDLNATLVYVGGEAAAQPSLLGTTHNSSMATFLTALAALNTALAAHAAPLGPYPDPALVTATATFAAALTAFSSSLASMLTTKARVV